MPLIKLDNATLRYGMQALLDQVNLQIDPLERVCLVGRNGEGKSTLLRVLQGDVALESGHVWHQPALRMAYLPQDVPDAEGSITVYEIVAGALDAVGKLLNQYHAAALAVANSHSDEAVRRLAELQHELETQNGWQIQQQVETVLSKLELDADAKMASLSGGYKRRVLFARALVNEPELLLLDEPTNHLDLATIEWLEDFLLGFRGALLFITHDRAFLRRLATRIIELDRGQLTSWPGNYDDYLAKREQRLADEAKHNAQFDKKLASEEVWIRQGIKARRTRNEGRVRALKALREQRRQRRELAGTATMRLDSGIESGKVVVEATAISKTFADAAVFQDFSTTIMRGDRVGIIGPNGAGKSTLLKVLLGELTPDSGKIKFGTRLQVAYFDQQRAQLDPERSVVDNITDRADTIDVGGKSRHVLSHLQDFLFSPDRARAKVKTLSGGERSRLLLARLFMKPANVLVLDEPTNDLDVETLELLEDLLADYDGTVLLVSHDRAFLDNVVTSTVVFEGNGKIAEYVGGYSDWLRQRPKMPAPSKQTAQVVAVATPPPAQKPVATAKKKLSYKEQRELEQLPGRIERLEQEQSSLQQQVNATDFYRGDQQGVQNTLARLEDIAGELETAYTRWAELE